MKVWYNVALTGGAETDESRTTGWPEDETRTSGKLSDVDEIGHLAADDIARLFVSLCRVLFSSRIVIHNPSLIYGSADAAEASPLTWPVFADRTPFTHRKRALVFSQPSSSCLPSHAAGLGYL